MNVAVIGSGVSGVFVAHALAARGLKVTIFDVGETLDQRRSAVVERLRNLPPAQWSAQDHALIRENPTFGQDALPKKVHFGSDYIYANDRPFAHLKTLVEGRVPYPTFAKGGFSNIWGAATLPPDDCDMADWPVRRAEMEPYFHTVAKLIPLTGGTGTLSRAFPAYRETLGDLDPGPQGQALLADLQRVEPRLLAAQTLYGKARLAIHTNAPDSGGAPCIGCGHCFTGCVFGSIFSTLPMLGDMIRANQVEYRPGIFVERVGETAGKAEIGGIDTASGQRVDFSFDGIFVAAGPINTTRLLLRSKRLYDRPVLLKESQKFVVPLLRRHGADTAIDHPSVTLASAFLETKVSALSDHWVHVQLIPMNQMIVDGARLPGLTHPLGRRLWRPVLRRTMAAWCGLHSDHSSHVALCLRAPGTDGLDTLELDLRVSEPARAAARQVARNLFGKGLMFGTLFLHGMIRFSNPGSGTHCGSSFPMKATPSDLLDSDVLGRPFGWSRVFAVNSSVLPSIPATTLAFPVMANAYRIGSLAPL